MKNGLVGTIKILGSELKVIISDKVTSDKAVLIIYPPMNAKQDLEQYEARLKAGYYDDYEQQEIKE